MRAAMIRKYGGPEVVTIESVPLPPLEATQVRVKVHAAPLTAGDVRLRSAVVPSGLGLLVRLAIGVTGPRKPVPGWGFAGTVHEVGASVGTFRPGQRVFGIMGFSGGAHAEYATLAADSTVLPLPDSLSMEEGAAFFFGGLTAADFLIDKGQMKPGEHLAIIGATGSVGSAAISIAKHLGLTVTAVASRANLELARSLGADELVDYRTQSLTGRYDGILDVMGALPRAQALSLLKPHGRLMPVTATLLELIGAGLRPRRGTLRITGNTTSEAKEKLSRLVDLHRAGGYRPVVGSVMPFSDIVEAHRRAETFHKQGNLVLRLVA